MIKRLLPLTVVLFLAACVDTSGLSGDLHDEIHPDSNPSASVIVAEYADLQCPACRAAHEIIMKPLLQEYGTKIQYEFHHFPLSSLHRFAVEAAEAAECAADQDKFWEYVNLVFTNQDKISREMMEEWGRELNLDMELFNRCRESHVKRDAILDSYEEGKDLGIRGTPTFFVNGRQVESTLEAIKAAVDETTDAQKQLL